MKPPKGDNKINETTDMDNTVPNMAGSPVSLRMYKGRAKRRSPWAITDNSIPVVKNIKLRFQIVAVLFCDMQDLSEQL